MSCYRADTVVAHQDEQQQCGQLAQQNSIAADVSLPLVAGMYFVRHLDLRRHRDGYDRQQLTTDLAAGRAATPPDVPAAAAARPDSAWNTEPENNTSTYPPVAYC